MRINLLPPQGWDPDLAGEGTEVAHWMQRGCCDVALVKLTRNFPPGWQPKLFKGRWLAGGTCKTAKGCRHWGSCWLLDSAARRDPPSWARQKLPALKEPSAAGVPISRLQEPDKRNTLEPGRKACAFQICHTTRPLSNVLILTTIKTGSMLQNISKAKPAFSSKKAHKNQTPFDDYIFYHDYISKYKD